MKKIACISILLLLAVPAIASAHAAYKDSSPQDEASVAAPPASVWAEYTEPLQDGSHMEIYDPCGAQVDNDDTQITGYRMTISMTGDMSGVYRVGWVAASAIDPHVTRGEFTFTVTDGPSCKAEPAPVKPRPESQEEASTEAESGGTSKERTAATASGADRKDAATETRVKAGRITARLPHRDKLRVVAQEEGRQVPMRETGIWDGIPWDWFGIALLLSAAIGAAGGRIYAGIMGPRR
jgi:methionine-rich copper-binding protein CopC